MEKALLVLASCTIRAESWQSEKQRNTTQSLQQKHSQDETEFLTMFTELISQFETLPLKSKKGKAYNTKLNQMLRMLQVQNIEKYNQLLPMYQQAEEKSRKKKPILAKIIMGYGIIWGIMLLIAIIVLVVFKDEIFKDEASGMLQKQAIEAIA